MTINWNALEQADYGIDGDPAGSRPRILDAIARTAYTNLRAYSNCARSTLGAVTQHLGLDAEDALRAASTLAGGICGTGETCGAVLGALMAIGVALGPRRPEDAEQNDLARATAATMIARFTELHSSTRCYEIQERTVGWRCDDPSKTAAWIEADGPVRCALVCAEAARAAAESILDATGS